MANHAKIEKTFTDRAKANGLKPGSAKFRNAEVEFFCGAMAAIEAAEGQEGLNSCTRWYLMLTCGRSIVGGK